MSNSQNTLTLNHIWSFCLVFIINLQVVCSGTAAREELQDSLLCTQCGESQLPCAHALTVTARSAVNDSSGNDWVIIAIERVYSFRWPVVQAWPQSCGCKTRGYLDSQPPSKIMPSVISGSAIRLQYQQEDSECFGGGWFLREESQNHGHRRLHGVSWCFWSIFFFKS